MDETSGSSQPSANIRTQADGPCTGGEDSLPSGWDALPLHGVRPRQVARHRSGEIKMLRRDARASHVSGPELTPAANTATGPLRQTPTEGRTMKIPETKYTAGPSRTASEDRALRIADAAPELLAALSNILYAHDTGNCGASNGEANLCKAYAEAARHAIAKAEGK